jgi:hypothetical protein
VARPLERVARPPERVTRPRAIIQTQAPPVARPPERMATAAAAAPPPPMAAASDALMIGGECWRRARRPYPPIGGCGGVELICGQTQVPMLDGG